MARSGRAPRPPVRAAIACAARSSAATTRRRVGTMPAVAKAIAWALACVVFALPFVSARPASASTTYSWTGNGDGETFGNANNWSPSGGPPQDGDSIEVAGNLGGPAHVLNT